MPRALPASARTEPPMTSPPLVAASRRSSVSTIAERRSLERISGSGPRSSHPGSPDDHHYAPRPSDDYMDVHGGAGDAALRSSSSSAGSRRSFDSVNGRPGSYRRGGGSNRNSGLWDVSDDEEGEQAQRDDGRATSPSPLTSMSLHTVGRKSSIASASTPPLQSASLPSSSRRPDFERGHRTMLSSGSVRSIGRRSSVNSAASDAGSAPHSPQPRPADPLPSLGSSAVALDQADEDDQPRTPETSGSSASVTPTMTFPAVASPEPRPPGKNAPMQKLLEHLLPPGAAEYPHAPGHSTPHAFEEGCSHPPSPRPQNHYRHERDGHDWRPSTLGEEVLSQYQRDELGTPKRVKEAVASELNNVTPRRTTDDRGVDEPTPKPSSSAAKSPLATFPPDAPSENGDARSTTTSPTRPYFASSSSAPSSSILPRAPPSSQSLMPSASIATRPVAGLPRNVSYNSYGALGASRPSIASAIRERRRQASLMANSHFPPSLSASSSIADLNDRGMPQSMSNLSITSMQSSSSGVGADHGSSRAPGQSWQAGSSPDPAVENGGPPISPKSFVSDPGAVQQQQQPAARRVRSRGPTRMGLGDLGPSQDFSQYGGGANKPRLADSFARALQQGLEMGMIGDVVMTPTTEEWHQLGGLPGEMRKFRDDPDIDEEDEASSDEEDELLPADGRKTSALGLAPRDASALALDLPSKDQPDSTPPRRPATSASETPAGGTSSMRLPSMPGPPQYSPTASLRSEEVPTPTQEPPGFLPVSSSIQTTQVHQDPVHGIIETHPDMKSVPMLSAMSTQSINSVTSIESNSTDSSHYTSASMIFPWNTSPRAHRNGVPLCSLLHDGIVQGPVDPRVYSAMTGRRNIDSFVIEGEAGKGAYGVVRRAREKGPDGLPTGPDLIIKYIVKQKILADCWKKHRVLGPIPIEIHVLDHLRRVPYRPSLIHASSKVHRRPPSRRTSTFIPLSPGQSLISIDPLANGDPRTGHPNICGILDYFEDNDYYYMVMPRFGDGQDLFDYVDLAPDGLPLHEVRSIFGQVADAVAFLHEHNIVHRDIKDENVIMDGFGNVQLIDFGSAAYIREGKLFDTFSGTLDFAAPEVLRGERHGGREIDVWALGVLLYVLICGECPFWSSAEASQGIERSTRAFKALEAKMRLLNSDSTPPAEGVDAEKLINEGIKPDDAFDLVCRCLAIEARDRPTAEQACQHRFLAGPEGWIGRVRPLAPVGSDNESS